jgi:GrpB-like predicted nucleotidyltransferase (UPF0157 family)
VVNVDEDVHVVDPDPAWAAKFLCERTRIVAVLGDLDPHLEHIGSTAIPGLPAKPIVDMMLGTELYPPTARLIEAISALGYENVGEAGVPGRIYFRCRGATSYNLHVVSYLGTHWQSNIKLRDYLARSAAARARYTAAKLEAVRMGATRLIAYSEAKAGIVNELLKEAAMRSNNSLERTREG